VNDVGELLQLPCVGVRKLPTPGGKLTVGSAAFTGAACPRAYTDGTTKAAKPAAPTSTATTAARRLTLVATAAKSRENILHLLVFAGEKPSPASRVDAQREPQATPFTRRLLRVPDEWSAGAQRARSPVSDDQADLEQEF
jgi:hypothetical protein